MRNDRRWTRGFLRLVEKLFLMDLLKAIWMSHRKAARTRSVESNERLLAVGDGLKRSIDMKRERDKELDKRIKEHEEERPKGVHSKSRNPKRKSLEHLAISIHTVDDLTLRRSLKTNQFRLCIESQWALCWRYQPHHYLQAFRPAVVDLSKVISPICVHLSCLDANTLLSLCVNETRTFISGWLLTWDTHCALCKYVRGM